MHKACIINITYIHIYKSRWLLVEDKRQMKTTYKHCDLSVFGLRVEGTP